MKHKLRLHPPLYEVARTEALYERQAARGWFLEKRGRVFSRFEKGEPQSLRCRVEFSTQECSPGAPGLPPEQIAIYEECGWRLAAFHEEVNIFCAPADSDIPELYTESTPQEALLERMRAKANRNLWGLIASLIFFVACVWGLFHLNIYRVGCSPLLFFYITPLLALSIFAAVPIAVLFGLFEYRALRILCRRLEKGEPLDRTKVPRFTIPPYQVLYVLFRIFVVAALLLTYVQMFTEDFHRGDFEEDPF